MVILRKVFSRYRFSDLTSLLKYLSTNNFYSLLYLEILRRGSLFEGRYTGILSWANLPRSGLVYFECDWNIFPKCSCYFVYNCSCRYYTSLMSFSAELTRSSRINTENVSSFKLPNVRFTMFFRTDTGFEAKLFNFTTMAVNSKRDRV